MKLIKNKGFSLIELIIVVSIVATLGAIGVPTYLKRQTRARRSECTTMLSTLSTMQTSYITEEAVGTNRIFCPKNDDGLHVWPIGATSKNVLTMLRVEAERFCTTNLGANNFPEPNSSTNLISYQYGFHAAQWNQLNPAGTASGIGFPQRFDNGATNIHGYAHPRGNFSGPNGGANGNVVATSGNVRQFQIRCRGNIDDDTRTDEVLIDHLGNTTIINDDVND